MHTGNQVQTASRFRRRRFHGFHGTGFSVSQSPCLSFTVDMFHRVSVALSTALCLMKGVGTRILSRVGTDRRLKYHDPRTLLNPSAIILGTRKTTFRKTGVMAASTPQRCGLSLLGQLCKFTPPPQIPLVLVHRFQRLANRTIGKFSPFWISLHHTSSVVFACGSRKLVEAMP